MKIRRLRLHLEKSIPRFQVSSYSKKQSSVLTHITFLSVRFSAIDEERVHDVPQTAYKIPERVWAVQEKKSQGKPILAILCTSGIVCTCQRSDSLPVKSILTVFSV